jgi:hypothetical protein
VLDESYATNGDRFMGFAGMERETITGLELAVERVENPVSGRWDTEDPSGLSPETTTSIGTSQMGRLMASTRLG